MTESFVQALKSYFTAHPFTDDRMGDAHLFAYDSLVDKRTYLTSDVTKKDDSLCIDNQNLHGVVHVCIDGGLVEYGLERYQDDEAVHERCDCMVFTNTMLYFVEFKMNATSTSDKAIWRNCSDAMRAIRDFVTYLYRVFLEHDDDFHRYYPLHSASAIVCIKQSPGLHPKRNSQRLTQKANFTTATHLKVEFTTHCDIA